jgi:hypothetical protein
VALRGERPAKHLLPDHSEPGRTATTCGLITSVSKDGYIYLLGGERGFSCCFDPASPCQPATATLYYNDVWRSRDGASWQLVTASAGWSARPGHQCLVLINDNAFLVENDVWHFGP